ncbi:MAG: right-handed parallel beta-helix repeat-containing protein [Deltaproteobacteria bacterium]|nr:right-handed parallel beta-helix repeat-containing protein [Deltaproteobacteria bacterium]
MRRAALAIATVALAAPAAAVNYYLSPDGTDSGDCTASGSPCQTLSYALAQATGPGDVIAMAGGSYLLDHEVVVGKSGAAGSPLTIRGAGVDVTVVDGSALPNNRNAIEVQADHVAIEDLTATRSSSAPIRIAGAGNALRRVSANTPRSNNTPCLMLVDASDTRIESFSAHACTRYGIQIDGSSGIALVQPTVSGARTDGIHITDTTDVVIAGATVRDNSTSCPDCSGIALSAVDRITVGAHQAQQPTVVAGHTGSGLTASNCGLVGVANAIFFGNGSGVDVTVAGSTLVANVAVTHAVIAHSTSAAAPAVGWSATSGQITVKNSILAFNAAADILSAAIVHSHNLRFDNGSGGVALAASELAVDPLFADAAAGDFHVQSEAGRYLAGTGWVMDSATSYAIDLADPASPYSNETAPNGARANAGAYGNTIEASRTAPRPDAGRPDIGPWPDAAVPDSSARDRALPDWAGRDLDGVDLAQPDSGQRVLARAGPDLVVDTPADIVLDGTASLAPAGAAFTWTQKVGPAGMLDRVVGSTAQTAVRVDQAGLWIYELRIEAAGASSTDLLQVEARGASAAECGCRQLDRRCGYLLLGIVLTGLLVRRRCSAR